MSKWIGPIYKKLAGSELGAGHTSGIVPTKNIKDFFGTPLKKETHLIKSIVIEFWSENNSRIIKTNVKYYKAGTHDHIHLTGNLMPIYKKEGATKGDILLFWKSQDDEHLFKAELVKKNSKRWNRLSDNFSGAGGKFCCQPPGLNVNFEDHSNEYQEESEVDQSLNDDDFPPIRRLEIKGQQTKKLPPRNKAKGDYVLKKKDYKCEINNNHVTFITRKGMAYMEKHHLIPMKYYEEFEINIDDINNIICICPLCHRMLHQGKKEDIEPMIEKLFELRIEGLKKININLELNRLKKMYNI